MGLNDVHFWESVSIRGSLSKLEKFQHSSALPNIKYNCAILFLGQCSGRSKRGTPGVHPPMAQNFLNFLFFLENFGQIIGWCPLLEGWCPLLRGILDPPLKCIGHLCVLHNIFLVVHRCKTPRIRQKLLKSLQLGWIQDSP